MNLSREMSREDLAEYIHGQIPGLLAAIQEKHVVEAAFMLRSWLAWHASYPQRGLLIYHWEHTVPEILCMLESLEGGLWCGGCAYLFTNLLNALRIPAAVYMYGHGDLSHETTVFGVKEGKEIRFYLLDSYLTYHYVYAGTQKMIALDDLLRLIRMKEYDRVQRMDTPIPRRFVTRGDAGEYAWLCPNGAQLLEERNGIRAYSYAVPSVDRLLQGGPFRELVDQARGSQDLNEFMLDLMLVKPTFSRISEAAEGYPDYALLHGVINGLGSQPEWMRRL